MNLKLRQIWIGLAILGALVAALLLNLLVVTDHERVTKVIRSMAEAAGRADVDALLSHVAADYADDLQDRVGLQASAERLFSRYGPLRVTIQRMTVNVSGRLASVEVTLSGRGVYRGRSESLGVSVWTIQLRKDDDGVWRVTHTTPRWLWENEIGSWRELMKRLW